MKKNRIAQLMLASSIMVSTNVFAACYGNVYSMNAGRGHVGALIDLKESASLDNNYFQNASERAAINSKALFSSSAMAYDENTNRIYYSNVPTPTAYHINDTETFFSDDELASLDFHAKSSERFKLAYYDVATGEHVEVANTKYQIMRMAFSPETGELYASDANRLFTVNPTSGETTQIALFPTGPRNGGFTNWGDFEFYKGELLFVTNGRSYSVDLSTADLTLKAFHFVDFVSSVTTDQNGQLIMAAKNQNVSGNVNNNRLWRFNPSTGEKVQVGLFPTRISAMATVTSEEHTCYEPTAFESDQTEITINHFVDNGVAKHEGGNGQFIAVFDNVEGDDATVNIALIDGTAVGGSDYDRTATLHFQNGSGTTTGESQQITLSQNGTPIDIPEGTGLVSVYVDYLQDNIEDDVEKMSVSIWGNEDKSDKKDIEVTV
ncbi:YncE family protein, partial [Enterovibrio norvegicus]|uniref:YncE family protein n=1 Tax=Enterovibrio norvegicus TaxID=188144 RepID=UPI003553AF7D